MKHGPFITHGVALLTGAAIAVAGTYHASSGAQASQGAAQIADAQNSPPALRMAINHPAETVFDEDAAANAFDQITAQVIGGYDTRSEAGYREWLKNEAAMARY